MTQQDTQPPAETLAEAQEIAIHFALPGMYDGISTHATRRGDADDKPYMRAILAALTRRAGGDIPAGARERIAAYIAELLGAIQPFAIAAERADEVNALRDHSDGAHVYPWNYVNSTHFADAFGAYSERLDPDDWAILSATPKPPAGGDAGAVEPSKRAVAYAYLKLRQSKKREMAKALGLPLPDAIGGQLEQDKAFLKSVFDAGRVADLAAALALPAPVVEGEGFTGEQAWDELVNVDDRTSPEEYPDMCLITRDELIDFMNRAALSEGRSHG